MTVSQENTNIVTLQYLYKVDYNQAENQCKELNFTLLTDIEPRFIPLVRCAFNTFPLKEIHEIHDRRYSFEMLTLWVGKSDQDNQCRFRSVEALLAENATESVAFSVICRRQQGGICKPLELSVGDDRSCQVQMHNFPYEIPKGKTIATVAGTTRTTTEGRTSTRAAMPTSLGHVREVYSLFWMHLISYVMLGDRSF